MISKLKSISLLFAISIFIFSCTKHPDNIVPVIPVVPIVPVIQPPAVQIDSLGAGWQSIKIDSINLDDIFFVNKQIGFLCGDKYLGKSIDGGLTWTSVIPDSLSESFNNLFFIDVNNGWATGQNFLLQTTDGGNSWKKVHKGSTFDVQFFDINNGYITVPDKGLFKTTDGGKTMLPVFAASAAKAIFFINENKGWFSGNAIYKTINAGLSFSTMALTGSILNAEYAIQFTDSLHGWIGGGGNIFRSVDGGGTFEMIANTNLHGGDIHFFDNNNGFILANNKIYSTTDGGITLKQLCAINKGNLLEIYFIDPDHGWATGDGGLVYCYVKQ